MVLDGILDVLDGVEERLAKEYVKGQDGKFYLQVKGSNGWSFENVSGLRSALESEKADRRTANDKLQAFSGIDAAEAKRLMARKAEMDAWKPDTQTESIINDRLEQAGKKHKQDLDAETARANELESALNTQLIDVEVMHLMSGKGAGKLLLPHIKETTKIEKDSQGVRRVRVLNESGHPRMSLRSGQATQLMTLEEYVMDVMRNDKEFSRAFDADENNGSGASGRKGTTGGSGGSRTMTALDALDGGSIDDIASGKVKIV